MKISNSVNTRQQQEPWYVRNFLVLLLLYCRNTTVSEFDTLNKHNTMRMTRISDNCKPYICTRKKRIRLEDLREKGRAASQQCIILTSSDLFMFLFHFSLFFFEKVGESWDGRTLSVSYPVKNSLLHHASFVICIHCCC